MGKSHAATGLAVGAGIGLAVFGLSSPTWLAASVAVCGASILPDIDEPGSSVSREFGIISQGFSAVVNKLAGGHRKLTHSLLGLGIVTLILVLSATGRDASAVIFGVLVASAWRIVFPWWTGLRRLFVFIGVGGGYFFYHFHPFSGQWLIALLGIGWLVHMAGDFLTHGGIPLLYPRSRRESLPIFGTTGSTSETIFAGILYAVVAVTMGLWFSHHLQIPQMPNPAHYLSQIQHFH